MWNYIIINLETQGKRTATEIITIQLQTLKDAGLQSKNRSFL